MLKDLFMLENLITLHEDDLKIAFSLIALGSYNLMEESDIKKLKSLPFGIREQVVNHILSSWQIASDCPKCIQEEVANIAINHDELVNNLNKYL